jgi:hypothetical protein
VKRVGVVARGEVVDAVVVGHETRRGVRETVVENGIVKDAAARGAKAVVVALKATVIQAASLPLLPLLNPLTRSVLEKKVSMNP